MNIFDKRDKSDFMTGYGFNIKMWDEDCLCVSDESKVEFIKIMAYLFSKKMMFMTNILKHLIQKKLILLMHWLLMSKEAFGLYSQALSPMKQTA